MRMVSTVLAAAVMMGTAFANAEPASPADAAAFITKFVDGQTVVVGRVDLSRVDVDKLFTAFQGRTGLNLAPFQPEREAAKALGDELRKAKVKDLYLIGRIGEAPRLIAPVENAELAARADKILAAIGGEAKQADGALVISKRGEKAIATGQAVAAAEIQKAFEAAEGATAQFALMLSADARRVIADFLPTYGGHSTTAVTRDFQWGSVAVELEPTLQAQLVTNCNDARGAEDLKSFLDALIAEGGKFVAKHETTDNADKLSVRPRVENLNVIIDADELLKNAEETKALVRSLVSGIWVPAARQELSTRIKYIGLAIHNYHDVNNSLPPQGSNTDGKTMLLSWRVHILPWLDEAALYKEFHLDEPWDSEHNKKLIPRMPDTYKLPRALLLTSSDGEAEPGATLFQAPGAKGTVMYGPTPLRFRDVKDGLANTTMMIVSPKAKPVVWTEPEDLGIDLENPYAALGGDANELIYVLIADGSSGARRGLTPAEFRALLTIDGGEKQ